LTYPLIIEELRPDEKPSGHFLLDNVVLRWALHPFLNSRAAFITNFATDTTYAPVSPHVAS
jgi:hypothetical protein